MNQSQARALQRTIEDLLEGNEIGLLRAEESPHIPGHWGVTIKLTSRVDWPALKRAIERAYSKPDVPDEEDAEQFVPLWRRSGGR